jgi:hypothetical protein
VASAGILPIGQYLHTSTKKTVLDGLFIFYPVRPYALLHFGANGDIMVLLLRTEAFDNENNQTFGSLACGVHNVMLHGL